LSLAAATELPVLSEESGLDATAGGSSGTYFDNGRSLTGFATMVGGDPDNLVVVEGLELAGDHVSPAVLMADREVQGDSSLLRWADGAPGYFAIRADGNPLDL